MLIVSVFSYFGSFCSNYFSLSFIYKFFVFVRIVCHYCLFSHVLTILLLFSLFLLVIFVSSLCLLSVVFLSIVGLFVTLCV